MNSVSPQPNTSKPITNKKINPGFEKLHKSSRFVPREGGDRTGTDNMLFII